MQVSKFLRLRGCALAIALSSTPALAADYTIDPSHSFVQFRISHLGFSVLNGRFNDIAGTLQWDKAKPDASNIELTIKTTSIASNWAERDKHIRSKDFLEVEKFPEAKFKSTKYTGDASAGKLDGELTLHGVTKPIALDVKAVGEGDDPWGGYRAGFTGTTTLKRADFGVSYNLGPTAETMQFDLFIEAIKKK